MLAGAQAKSLLRLFVLAPILAYNEHTLPFSRTRGYWVSGQIDVTMHALIVCEDGRLAELLTVALRQVGLRGVVRRTLPVESHQVAEAAVLLLNSDSAEVASEALWGVRTLTSAPLIVLCPAADDETQLDLYHRGATLVAPKPVDLRLLAAQALALTRIAASAATVPAPHPMLDPETQSVSLPDGVFRLSPLEFRLLAALLSRPGRVFPPETLVEHVWGYSGDGDRSLVKSLVNRVRRKIEPSPQTPVYLVTETGVGYRFMPPENGSGDGLPI